jgi:integrase
VQAALLTGARYGELCELQVGDFSGDRGMVYVRTSKSGRPRHIVLNDEGTSFFESETVGRAPNEPMFPRPDGAHWGRDLHRRLFKEAVMRAGLDPAFTFHELRHTWASLSIMAGAPLMVVAQNLGHVDTRMVELHYGHLAQTYVIDTIRRTAPSFGFASDRKIAALK